MDLRNTSPISSVTSIYMKYKEKKKQTRNDVTSDIVLPYVFWHAFFRSKILSQKKKKTTTREKKKFTDVNTYPSTFTFIYCV